MSGRTAETVDSAFPDCTCGPSAPYDSHEWDCPQNPQNLAQQEIDRLRAEVKRWKDHAEEAGEGFSQACKDYARVSARNLELRRRIEALVLSPEAVQYRDEACRHVVNQPYADNRYVRLLDAIREAIQ